MNYVCAWCSKLLDVPAGQVSPEEGTSHGICDDCSLTFIGIRKVPLEQLVNRVSVPVMVIASDCRIAGANPAVAALLGKTPEAIAGRLPGEAIDCVGACMPGGCGHSEICPACVFRRNVEATAQDGISRHGLLSRHRMQRGELEKTLQFRFSTAKIGDAVVANLDHPAAGEATDAVSPRPGLGAPAERSIAPGTAQAASAP